MAAAAQPPAAQPSLEYRGNSPLVINSSSVDVHHLLFFPQLSVEVAEEEQYGIRRPPTDISTNIPPFVCITNIFPLVCAAIRGGIPGFTMIIVVTLDSHYIEIMAVPDNATFAMVVYKIQETGYIGGDDEPLMHKKKSVPLGETMQAFKQRMLPDIVANGSIFYMGQATAWANAKSTTKRTAIDAFFNNYIQTDSIVDSSGVTRIRVILPNNWYRGNKYSFAFDGGNRGHLRYASRFRVKKSKRSTKQKSKKGKKTKRSRKN